MSKKTERKNRIMQILQEVDSLLISDLADQFNVVEMTIRRDVHDLIKLGFVEQKLGVVYPVKTKPHSDVYNLYKENLTQTEAKKLISQFAATLVEPNDTIIIDAGSTTERLINHLPNNLNLTIICYNYNILEQLIKNGHEDILFLGGYYRPLDQMFESQFSVSLLETIRANKVFYSASGVHKSLGVTCGHNYVVPIKQTAFRSSGSKLLLIDSTKFGKVAGSYFAQLKDFDVLITDSGIPNSWRQYLSEELGITLHVVNNR